MQPNYPWFRIFSVPGEKIFPALVQKDFCPWFGNFSNPVHADLRDQKKRTPLISL